MFLTCEGTFGIVPATMDYNGEARPGDFHAGYQEIEGINLGYLQINGTQMFALAQVLSDLFKDIPRTTISKKMETLKIKSRRCDLKELRTLKAINSVPTRAPQPPREPLGEERPAEPAPSVGKALRPDPDLLFLSQQLWARTLRASTLESLSPVAALGSGIQALPELSSPGGAPQQKEGGFGDAEPCAKGKDLHKDASNNRASLGPSDQAGRQSGASAGPVPAQEPAPGSAPQPPAQELAGSPGQDPPGETGEPRREHFDRLIRQSKLWCYAKGFNLDGKSLRHGGRTEPCKAAELKSPGSKRAESPSTLSNKALKGNGSERNAKRRRLARGAEAERQQSSSKGRPQKTQRRNAKKGNTHCKRLGSAGPTPPRNSFSLMGNFPCIPSLVVGED
ncbi:PREDICTED: uncharacterized protein C17orf96 homolog, partial [Chaetura pelagica]|uniref:uncharacterized protein C17orf96 homolog n=1 Tax=Chaetura pelagica TaxID=8897 RepID=UPI0005238E37